MKPSIPFFQIEFSIGGTYFDSLPGLEYSHYRDEIMPLERNVDIRLDHKIGRFMRIKLFYDAKWMLISELHFESGGWAKNAICLIKYKMMFD